MISFFTQSENDTSSEAKVPPEHGYFRNPEKFLNQPATHFSSLKCDADDEFSYVKKDTLPDFYAHNDCLSSYIASCSCQDPSAMKAKNVRFPIQSYLVIPHLLWPFSQKNLLKSFDSV